MDNDQIFHPQAKKISRLFNRFPAPIHEGHWLYQNDLLRIDPSCSVKRFETFNADRNVVYFGGTPHYLKSNIMPGPSIRDSRIPQSNDDLHIRLFFFLLLLFLYLSPFSSLRSHCFHNLLFHHRGHNGGDGKVGFRYNFCFLHLNILDMNGVTDLYSTDININALWNISGKTLDLDHPPDLIKDATHL